MKNATPQLASTLRRHGLLFLLALVSATTFAAEGRPENATVLEEGSVFIASAEGISVFGRDGAMRFGTFSTTVVEGMPGPAEWDDMIYDGWKLPSGNYLCSSHRYVRELAPDGTVLWEYRRESPSEVKSCVPLPNGDIMIEDATPMELVQITDQGRREVRRISVPTSPDAQEHDRYNLLRRTPAGTFLVALRHETSFVEVDMTGKELWRHPVPGLPIVAERLTNGNTLMSWRGGLIEAAPDHRVVWELKAEEMTDFTINIVGGFHRFANGNTLIANSDWHYKEAGQNHVQLFEVNRNKEVVWTLTTDAFAGKKPGSLEPSTGLVEHRIIGIQWLPAAAQSADAELLTRTIEFNGAPRTYYVALPRNYDADTDYWPLVVVHGGGGKAKANPKALAMRRIADERGLAAIVIMPAFITKDKQVSRFPALGEVDFLKAVLHDVRTEYKLRDKILLSGYSMGGQFTHRFALANPELIQACAPFAAGTWTTPDGRLLIEGHGEVKDARAFLSDGKNKASVPERLHNLFDKRTAAVAGLPAAKGADTVPFLVMCGMLDTRLDIAQAFAAQLEASGYVVETEWPRTPHGSKAGEFAAEFEKYPAHAIAFFERHTTGTAE